MVQAQRRLGMAKAVVRRRLLMIRRMAPRLWSSSALAAALAGATPATRVLERLAAELVGVIPLRTAIHVAAAVAVVVQSVLVRILRAARGALSRQAMPRALVKAVPCHCTRADMAGTAPPLAGSEVEAVGLGDTAEEEALEQTPPTAAEAVAAAEQRSLDGSRARRVSIVLQAVQVILTIALVLALVGTFKRTAATAK